MLFFFENLALLSYSPFPRAFAASRKYFVKFLTFFFPFSTKKGVIIVHITQNHSFGTASAFSASPTAALSIKYMMSDDGSLDDSVVRPKVEAA